MTRVLVTAAGLPTGRNAVRALIQQDGIEVLATDWRESALARMPFDVPKLRLPPVEDPNFAEALRLCCLENDIEVLLPGMDSIAMALSKEKALFTRSGIAVPVPEYSVLLRGVDKSNLVDMARAAGIPHPNSISLQSEGDLEKLAALAYPVIVKPRLGHGARGVMIFERPPRDWSKLKKALKKGGMLAQEYVPGGAGSIHACGLIFDQGHEIKFAFQSKSTRTEFEFGGPAFAGVSLHEPVIRAYGERLVRAVGPWIGVVMIEFKRHSENGDFYVLDLNPRIWGYSSLAEDAGLSFPLALVLVAKNESFCTHEDYLTDVHMERQQLFDRTTYSFCGGKKVTLSRQQQTIGRRVIALITNEQDTHAVSSAVDDAQIDAILVLRDSAEEGSPISMTQEKVYVWSPPPHIRRQDLPYWAAHMLQGTTVIVIDGKSYETHSWHDLRQSWWFGLEDSIRRSSRDERWVLTCPPSP